MAASSLARFLISSLACAAFVFASPALGLTLQDLNEGSIFTTTDGLIFSEFYVESNYYDPADIMVDVLSDGFAYSLTLPYGAVPSPGTARKKLAEIPTLSIYYAVDGLGPGELLPVPDGTKKKAVQKGWYGGVYAENYGETLVPFDEVGSFFLDESQDWVAYLGAEGTLADGFVDNSLAAATRKKKATTDGSEWVPPDIDLLSQLMVIGYGEVTATQRFSTGPAIPEPVAATLFGVGLLVVAARLRRRAAR
jgi:hypothetical protein